MSNFDINIDRQMDEQTDEWKSGCLCYKVKEVREMFHARFDGCLVL